MKPTIYENILSEICSAIRNVPDNDEIEKKMIKILAEKMLLDTMPNEEQMNDSFRDIHYRQELIRRREAFDAECLANGGEHPRIHLKRASN